MNKALRFIFWGYLFIFFRIDILIDLLMDPIGYFLIYAGCSRLVDAYPNAKKARAIGMIGIFVSVPSVFVNLSDAAIPIGWSIYGNLLLVLKLMIAFYLFIVLVEITKAFGDRVLQNRTKNTFIYYVFIHLITLAILSFSMNMPENGWLTLSLLSTIGVVLMDVLFLLLLGAIRRATPELLRIPNSMCSLDLPSLISLKTVWK